MKPLQLFFSISFFIFHISFFTSAQTPIKISGKAYNAHTKEPLSFINIFLDKTTLGTTTDIDGKYIFEGKKMSDTIVASCIGYEKMKIKITNAAAQIINFEMARTEINLTEIVIKAGENPAHPILRNIIKNKENNNKENLNSYQYEAYNKLEIDVDNINKDAISKKKLLKPFMFIFDNIDSTNKEEKPFLPFFLTETLSDFYYRKKPNGKREVIRASKISGVEDPTIAEYLSTMYQDINIYNNWIGVLGKNFASPISEHGLLHYKYYLVDSASISGKWCYKINFVPRRQKEFTFFGDFWVNDTSFAIKKISMQMSNDVNMNFVERLSVFQEFVPAKNIFSDSIKPWMLSKDKLIIDFISTKKIMNIPGKDKEGAFTSMGLIGRKNTSFKNIIVNDTTIDRHFKQPDEVRVVDGADLKDEAFWNKSRHDSLSKNEKIVYAMVDTIKKMPQFRTYIDVITFIVSGKKEFGKFDVGEYFKIASFNTVEGWRFRMGVNTNEYFSTRSQLSGFLAYGLLDEKFKYGASADYILTQKPWQKAGVSYQNDYNLSSENFDEIGIDNLFSSGFRRPIPQKLIRTEETKFYYERDWRWGISNRLIFSNRIINPSFGFVYEQNQNQYYNVNASEVSINTRFSYKSKSLISGYKRINIKSNYPVVNFQYVLGVKGVLNGGFDYHKFSFSVYDYVDINPIGMLYYKFSAGKIIGTLPYLLLENHKGNQTFYFDKYSFNTMTLFEFASDQYASVVLMHHFNGLLFNKIPLFRRLNWRELVTGRAVIGDMTDKNRAFNKMNDIKIPNKIPFVEVGCGIENIFKFFRIDAVWRVTHLEDKNPNDNIPIPKFGIYGSVQLQF